MADLVVDDIHWKKGETGVQKFEIYDSDKKTRRNGTGKTYSFKFWDPKTNVLKGSGTLTPTVIAEGKYDYIVLSGNTDTIKTYAGEVIEDPNGSKLRSNTFNVYVEMSSEGLV